MNVTASDVRVEIPIAEIPDGEYQGKWGGYTVTFKVDGKRHEAKTSIGVRCIDCPCTVVVRGGQIQVNAK